MNEALHPELTGSTRRWATAADFPQPPGKGPSGRRFCRWCHKEVPKGRRTWCSDKCVDEYWIRANAQEARRIVLARDGGVCSACGIDAGKLDRILRHAARHYRDGPSHRYYLGESVLIRQIGNFEPFGGTYWQADHIVPVSEGGGMCGPSNYRTLCTPCHLEETADLARRRGAREKRDRWEGSREGQLAQAQQELNV